MAWGFPSHLNSLASAPQLHHPTSILPGYVGTNEGSKSGNKAQIHASEVK